MMTDVILCTCEPLYDAEKGYIGRSPVGGCPAHSEVPRIQRKLADMGEGAGRVAIGGGPGTGKSFLSSRLEAIGIPVEHTDALIASHAWSELSEEVAKRMGEPGPWCVEGVRVVHSLRKRMKFDPGKPCDLLVWMSKPRLPLTVRQEGLRKSCETILAEIRPELEKRGVKILVLE